MNNTLWQFEKKTSCQKQFGKIPTKDYIFTSAKLKLKIRENKPLSKNQSVTQMLFNLF